MKNVLRMGGGLVAAFVAIAAMAMTSSTAALAATSTAASTVARAQPALPAGVPTRCPQGDFCSYNQVNGGGLCWKYSGNGPNMNNCANTDQSVFNNGYAGTYDVVFMYWGPNYEGAYTCLTQGNYWLYATDYKFNNHAPSDFLLDAYGETVASNVESYKWGYYDCGNWYSPPS